MHHLGICTYISKQTSRLYSWLRDEWLETCKAGNMRHSNTLRCWQSWRLLCHELRQKLFWPQVLSMPGMGSIFGTKAFSNYKRFRNKGGSTILWRSLSLRCWCCCQQGREPDKKFHIAWFLNNTCELFVADLGFFYLFGHITERQKVVGRGTTSRWVLLSWFLEGLPLLRKKHWFQSRVHAPGCPATCLNFSKFLEWTVATTMIYINHCKIEIHETLFVFVFPHITVGFLFSRLHPAGRRPPSSSVVRRRPPPRSLTHTSQNLSHHTQVMSHHTQLIPHHTPLISHTTHLTQHISHRQLTTPLISHHSSHTTTHLTHNSSHTTHLIHNSSHTTHLTHNSSHIISHNSSHTQLISQTTHLKHNSSYTQLISQTGAVHTASWRSCGADWQAQYTERPEGAAARIVAAVAAARFCVAGAVRRASRRGLSPQWPRLAFVWQARCAELPEGATARIVAAVAAAALCVAGAVHRASWRSCGADCRRSGRGSLLCGRRGAQSFLKELRRGLSPEWPRRLFAWQAQYTELPEGAAARIVAAVAAAVRCVAGAVHRASWRSCGADCRRSGRGGSLRGSRSTQSVLKELRRGLSPQWPRLFVVWQAQYTERPEGAAARIVAGVAAAALCVAGAVHRASWRSCGADCRRSGRGGSLRGRRSTQSFPKELRRGLSPEWPRRLFAWQAQYTEPPEGAAARIVAAVAAAALCVAGAVHRASRRSCGADCRRSGRGGSLRGRRSTQSLLKELRRGLSPQWPRWLFAWQAQYTELPEGAAARIVAGVAAAALCVAGAVAAARIVVAVAATGLSPQLYGRLQRRCLCDRSVSPQLYWCLQRTCLCDRSASPQLYWCL